MSYAGLLGQTGTVYRPSQTRTGLGDMPTTYQQVESVSLRITPPLGGLQDFGPGEQARDSVTVFFAPSADVAPRDVFEVTAGVGVGRRWRLTAVAPVAAGTPATHHIEAIAEPYTGPFP